MIVYFLIFTTIGCFSFLEITGKRFSVVKQKKIIQFFLLIFLFLGTVRWQTGADWDAYLSAFLTINEPQSFYAASFEPLYVLLNKIVRSLTDNYSVFLFVCSLILFFVHRSIFNDFCADKKMLDGVSSSVTAVDTKLKVWNFPFSSLLVFWSLYGGNVSFVRSSMAYIICFFSVKFILDKKPINFVFTVIIAGLIHRSSYVFLVAYPIANIKIKNAKGLFLTFLVLTTAIIAAMPVVKVIASSMNNQFSIRILDYLNADKTNTFGSAFDIATIITKGLANFGLILCMLLSIYNKHKKNKTFRIMANLYVCGGAIYVYSLFFVFGFARLSGIFTIAQIYLIPYIFYHYFPKINKKTVALVVIAYLGLRMYINIISLREANLPFGTIFGSII